MMHFGEARLLALTGPSFEQKLIDADRRPAGFDYLRIGLSLAVIWSHSFGVAYGVGYIYENFSGGLRPFLAMILPAFFALSGFLVAGSLERSRTLLSFLGLRVLRLVPALAVEIFLAAVFIGFWFTTLPYEAYFLSTGFMRYFLNVLGIVQFYLPGVFYDNPWPRLVNGQLWTLPYELYSYIALALLAVFGLVRGDRRFIIAIFVINITVFIIYFLIKNSRPGVTVSGPVLVLCFLYGVGFYIFRHRIIWNRLIFFAAAIATLVCLSFRVGDYLVGIPCAYVTIFLGLTTPRRRWIVSSGDYSYGLFLYGFPVQQAVVAAMGPAGRHWWINTAISGALAFGLSYISWHLVEKNALKLKIRLIDFETRVFGAAGNEEIAAKSKRLWPFAFGRFRDS
jgi:peptidoglycan/LPS O-acetylase OafA/YrhL